jgi:ATP-binding cassette subfamily B (MDR/TAP) protein 1
MAENKQKRFSQTRPSNSNPTVEPKKNNEDAPVKARWRSLFRFTTIRQLPLILVALAITIATSATKIVFAFYLGQLFELFTQLGNGTTKGPQMLEGVRSNILILLVIGGVSWVLNAGFLFIWITFAEFQVRCVRQELFTKLLDQDLSWYDMKEQGMGSFLSYSQKQVSIILPPMAIYSCFEILLTVLIDNYVNSRLQQPSL